MMQTPDSSKQCTADFTDQHIHGIAGIDFATSSQTQIRAALEFLASRRTTRVTASIPAATQAELTDILQRLHPLVTEGLLDGVHLEGPFLAPEYAGAHPHQALLRPDSDAGQAFVNEVLRHPPGVVTMMTVAPELEGFEQLIIDLVAHDITPALGHTAATATQMRDGIDLIYRRTNRPVVITHLYNAMRGFHHRDPGPLLPIVEAVETNTAIVELIADGRHVHTGLIAWWLEHYPRAVRLVSDASAATVPDNTQPLGTMTPRLGSVNLAYDADRGPRLADGVTLASGSKDLLAIHDDLIAAGIDHELVCTAMRSH